MELIADLGYISLGEYILVNSFKKINRVEELNKKGIRTHSMLGFWIGSDLGQNNLAGIDWICKS